MPKERILEDINDELVKLGYNSIDPADTFASHGVDSLDFAEIQYRLERKYDFEWKDNEADKAYGDQTISQTAEYLASVVK